MKKKVLFGLILLLTVIMAIQTTPLLNVFNKEVQGVYVSLNQSGFYSMTLEDDYVRYRCYVTLVNSTSDESAVRIRAMQLAEFMLGALKSPFMKVLSEDNQECVFKLAPYEESVLEVEFTTRKGWNAPLKMNRNLPPIIVI